MEHLLSQFCDISGQRVNRGKSRIWFSPNTPIYLRNSICLEFQVLPTSNLGTYLGIPICHGQASRTFIFLVDRVNRKLAGWKVKSLSRAARTILIQPSQLCQSTLCNQLWFLSTFSMPWIRFVESSSGHHRTVRGLCIQLHGGRFVDQGSPGGWGYLACRPLILPCLPSWFGICSNNLIAYVIYCWPQNTEGGPLLALEIELLNVLRFGAAFWKSLMWYAAW